MSSGLGLGLGFRPIPQERSPENTGGPQITYLPPLCVAAQADRDLERHRQRLLDGLKALRADAAAQRAHVGAAGKGSGSAAVLADMSAEGAQRGERELEEE